MNSVSDPDEASPQNSPEPRPGVKGRGHGAKSQEVRERAIVALLSENSIGAAAERCGLNEKTLRVWMADDEAFKQDLATARRAMFETAMNRLQPLAAQAVDTLAALMGESAPPSVRLGAARTVAELGIHRDDAETILRKLGEIEALQRRTETEEP
jgi:hypothetical protein